MPPQMLLVEQSQQPGFQLCRDLRVCDCLAQYLLQLFRRDLNSLNDFVSLLLRLRRLSLLLRIRWLPLRPEKPLALSFSGLPVT